MNFDFQSLIDRLTGLATGAFELIANPAVLIQLVTIAVLFGLSVLASNRVEPYLIEQARLIKGSPGTLRLIVATLRRLEWAFFVVLLAVSLAMLRTFGWLDSDYLTYMVLMLSLAWLLISIVSRTIHNRLLSRLVAVAGWTYVALTILGITETAKELLDAAGFSVGGVRLSLLLVVKAFVFLGGTLWVAISAGNFLDNRIQRNEELTPSLRVLIGKILKISLIVAAGFIAISGIGIDLTVFTVLSGAIGVGIGFGLQKVVSNFISGLIILLDRSIKPGDTISLGETFGWIRELRARFVSVVTRDGREYLIPNEDFITREVINWSFSDDYVRLDVPFGVSYDSDPHQVTELTIAAAAAVARVVPNPQPVCWMTGFGDSSLDFVLRFWISDPQKGLTNIRGQVLLAIWDAFKEHGVGIPYPHRQIIMESPVTILEGPPQPKTTG